MAILNEIYFSDSIIIDHLIDIITRMQSVEVNPRNTKEVNSLMREFSNALETFTGADRVEIDLESDTYAFTIPAPYEKRPRFKVTKEGIRFISKKNDVLILISASPKFLFKHKNDKYSLTPRETLSILLHEIGHNFSESILPIGSLFHSIETAIRIRNKAIIGMKLGKEDIKVDSDDIDTLSSMIIAMKDIIIETLSGDIRGIIHGIQSTISGSLTLARVASIFCIPVFGLYLATDIRKSYMDEVMADSFATMYGFGSELSSALNKLTNSSQEKTNKKYNIFTGSLMGLFILSLISLTDEHPSDMTRYKNVYNQLEYELKNNKDLIIEDRRKIERDMTKIKTLINEMSTLHSGDTYSLPWKIYYKILKNIMGGEEMFMKVVKGLIDAKVIDIAIRRME